MKFYIKKIRISISIFFLITILISCQKEINVDDYSKYLGEKISREQLIEAPGKHNESSPFKNVFLAKDTTVQLLIIKETRVVIDVYVKYLTTNQKDELVLNVSEKLGYQPEVRFDAIIVDFFCCDDYYWLKNKAKKYYIYSCANNKQCDKNGNQWTLHIADILTREKFYEESDKQTR